MLAFNTFKFIIYHFPIFCETLFLTIHPVYSGVSSRLIQINWISCQTNQRNYGSVSVNLIFQPILNYYVLLNLDNFSDFQLVRFEILILISLVKKKKKLMVWTDNIWKYTDRFRTNVRIIIENQNIWFGSVLLCSLRLRPHALLYKRCI